MSSIRRVGVLKNHENIYHGDTEARRNWGKKKKILDTLSHSPQMTLSQIAQLPNYSITKSLRVSVSPWWKL